MKKRILAIFLCLILTVSLAAAVAAEDLTVTLPPNILPPNMPNQPEIEPDDTLVPDDTTITLQIPITKVFELGGNTAPKQTTFSFYAFPSDPSYGRYEAGGRVTVKSSAATAAARDSVRIRQRKIARIRFLIWNLLLLFLCRIRT